MISKFSKIRLLLRLAHTRPQEFLDRLSNYADLQLDRARRSCSSAVITISELQTQLGNALGTALEPYLREPALQSIQREVEARRRDLLASGPAFAMFHNADLSLASLGYAIARATRASVVVETGVAHGVTSAYLLQALAANGAGELWSIDLPPLAEEAEKYVGILVPADLRPRWHLLRGATRRLLPELLTRLEKLDIFLHDSLHTFTAMSREFRTVWPKLRSGGILLSDDVEGNRAFQEFAAQPGVAFAGVAREQHKDSLLGVIVKRTHDPGATGQ